MSDGAYGGGGPDQGRGGVRGFLQETLQEERPSLLAEDDMLDLLLQPVSIDLLAAPRLATEESDPFLVRDTALRNTTEEASIFEFWQRRE